jgi:hypothetical protein
VTPVIVTNDQIESPYSRRRQGDHKTPTYQACLIDIDRHGRTRLHINGQGGDVPIKQIDQTISFEKEKENAGSE